MILLKICMMIGIVCTFGAAYIEASTWKQTKFIITCWSPPPLTPEALSASAKEGFNLIIAPEYSLDVVRDKGMMAMLQSDLLAPRILDNPTLRVYLDALINRIRNHSSLEAYYIADEPNASEFRGLGKMVAYLRERDPSHFAYINLFPVYATNKQLGTSGDPVQAYREYLRRFIDEVKPSLISYDHYHFYKTGDGDQYFLNLELIRQAAAEHGLPFINIIQASTIEKRWRLVTPNELRWLVYTTLAYGGRGISYFLYWGPPAFGGLYQGGMRTPLVDAVSVLNAELAAQSYPLMGLNHLGIYHTDPLPVGTRAVPLSSPVRIAGKGAFVLGLFGKNVTITTFMVVNRDYKTQATAQITLNPDMRDLEEFDRTSGQWKKHSPFEPEKGMVITLNPGDGRLFRSIR